MKKFLIRKRSSEVVLITEMLPKSRCINTSSFLMDVCLKPRAMQNPYYDTPHRFVDSIDKNHIIGSGHLRKQRKSTQRTHSKRSGSILITNDNNNIVEGRLHICIPTLSPTV